MQTTVKRTLVAATAVTAAGLFGSLPFQSQSQAAGVATVQHEVALVDFSSDLLDLEAQFNVQISDAVLGAGGLQDQLLTSFQTGFGDDLAAYLLDTNTASPEYSGIFNGAVSRLFEGVFLNGLSYQDQFNQLLGIDQAVSQQAIYDMLVDAGGPPIPPDAGVSLADLLSDVGSADFNTSLMDLADANLALATGDLQGYFADLVANFGTAFGDGGALDLGDLLGGLTGGLDLSDLLGGLDLSDILGGLDLGSLLGGLGL
jgi:hypothetical protein